MQAARVDGVTPTTDQAERAVGLHARSRRRTHFVRAAMVGLFAGLLAVAFRWAVGLVEVGRERLMGDLHLHPAWGWAVMPAAGMVLGCGVGWMTQRYAPEAGGSGIPHLKGVLLHLRTLSWQRLIPVKFVGGVLGIGAGLSLGREGPTVQMGAAVARALASWMRAPKSDVPQLLSAGAGAGLAAAFNAPLAGLVFVIEELHRELSSRTAAGALVAAVTATAMAQALAGNLPSIEVHGLGAMPLAALPLAAVIGGAGGLMAVIFNKGLLGAQSLALKQKRVPRWALPGIAAALVSVVAWWIPDVVGGGQGVAEHVLNGTVALTVGWVLTLMVAKFVMTVVCYASGAPGGVFAPMLLLGALGGTLMGLGVEQVWPAMASQTRVIAVLGMAAIFVGSVRAPLTGIVLISELTDGYELLFPICIASLVAYLTAEGLRAAPIYDALLEADLERSGLGKPSPGPRTVYIGVQAGSTMAGKRIAEAGLPKGCLVVAVERSGASLLPGADTVLMAGDHVSILTPGDANAAPLEIVKLCTGM